MMVIRVDTDNAAFQDDDLDYECGRILRKIARVLEDGPPHQGWHTILDVNGNDVGRWKVKRDWDGK